MEIKIDHDLYKSRKYLRSLFTKIPKKSKEVVKDALDEIRQLMIQKTQKIPASGVSSNSITNPANFVISEINSGKNSSSFRLRNIVPHAKFLEFGVKEHWIPLFKPNDSGYDLTKIQEYAKTKGYRGRWLHIGGPNSRIKKGKSQYKFFYNSIDEYLSSGRLNKKLSKKLKEVLK